MPRRCNRTENAESRGPFQLLNYANEHLRGRPGGCHERRRPECTTMDGLVTGEERVVKHQALRRAPAIVASIFGLLMAPPIVSAQTTIVRPTEIDDVLVNPGMGIETFQRFQGQPLNEGVRWSEVGPEAAGADASGGSARRFSCVERRLSALVLVAARTPAWNVSLVDHRRRAGRGTPSRAAAGHPDHAVRRQASDARLVHRVGREASQRPHGQGRRDLVAGCERSALCQELERAHPRSGKALRRSPRPQSCGRFHRRLLGRGLGSVLARLARPAAVDRPLLQGVPAHCCC